MAEDVAAWFAARVPAGWFSGRPDVSSDGEEILVMGTLPDVDLARDTADEGRAAARAARIDRFREETRDDRVRIAREAERQFRRKVAWGARCGDQERVFTTLSVPVMTRLRMKERAILDTLVAGGWRAAGARRWPGACAWSGCTRPTGSKGCARPWSKWTRSAVKDL